MIIQEDILLGMAWVAPVLGLGLSPLSGLLSPSFILAFPLSRTSTCRFSFIRLMLVPLVHTQSG